VVVLLRCHPGNGYDAGERSGFVLFHDDVMGELDARTVKLLEVRVRPDVSGTRGTASWDRARLVVPAPSV
jgi:hypothetical protein